MAVLMGGAASVYCEAYAGSRMAVDVKLLEKARRAPHRLSFEEALRLGRQLGFEKVRQVRGHRIFRHPALSPLNLQQIRS